MLCSSPQPIQGKSPSPSQRWHSTTITVELAPSSCSRKPAVLARENKRRGALNSMPAGTAAMSAIPSVAFIALLKSQGSVPELLFDPPVDAPGRAGGAVGPERLVLGRVLHRDFLVAAVRDQQQLAPGHLQGVLAEHAVLARAAVERHDVALAQAEELLVVRHPDLVGLGPVERGSLERALGERIGQLALEALEAGELLAPALAHRLAQLAVEIAEEEKRLAAAPLLAHEDQRRRRRQELDGRQRLYFPLVGKAQQPLAQRAVADLVVVLQEVDEARRRQMARLLAARLLGEWRHLARRGK